MYIIPATTAPIPKIKEKLLPWFGGGERCGAVCKHLRKGIRVKERNIPLGPRPFSWTRMSELRLLTKFLALLPNLASDERYQGSGQVCTMIPIHISLHCHFTFVDSKSVDRVNMGGCKLSA